jgi:hypothetical protein
VQKHVTTVYDTLLLSLPGGSFVHERFSTYVAIPLNTVTVTPHFSLALRAALPSLKFFVLLELLAIKLNALLYKFPVFQ